MPNRETRVMDTELLNLASRIMDGVIGVSHEARIDDIDSDRVVSLFPPGKYRLPEGRIVHLSDEVKVESSLEGLENAVLLGLPLAAIF